MMKVIFHVDDENVFPEAYANIKNLIATNQVEDIHLLLNGGPVELGIDNPYIRELSVEDHVRVSVCNNALRGMGINPEQIMKSVQIVPAGVLELVVRQSEGFAYIKP
ncbi:hypothetical protein G7062_10725 [Erysipelothrix sp. HDW6C]|uniref:DsrE family protein n=1 Tax=Erysipelothrix sp. HDW6C TaxID=2714930 RepID=UPI00140BCD0E|nr:DsrE family protein [Erysipelothrix sp. HDW6C]QIK70739.1 hypothetical protein G7062_10725 [Erysipelothrix sp. HDW6C]